MRVLSACVALTAGALGSAETPPVHVAERCSPGEDDVHCERADSPDEGALMQIDSQWRKQQQQKASPGHASAKPLKPLHYFPRHLTEYPVPGAVQTHELARIPSSIPGYDKILVTQISNSHLVEMTCDGYGYCDNAISTQIGSIYDGLHGCEPSPYISGPQSSQVLSTLQFANKLIILNVSGAPIGRGKGYYEPKIDFELSLAKGSALGPHRPLVVDTDVWITSKESSNLVRVSNVYKKGHNGEWTLNQPSACEVRVYDVQTSRAAPVAGPIFAQPVHHGNGKQYVYASLDAQGALARVDPSKGPLTGDAVEFVNLPANCPIAVGLITDPWSNVTLWFTCGAAGSPKRGLGTFGRVVDKGTQGQEVTIFHTNAPHASSAAYLHLSWTESTRDGFPQLLLLSSSIFGGETTDGLTTATFTKDFKYIRKNDYMTNTRQGVWFHRIIPGSGKALYFDGTLSAVVTSFYREEQLSFAETYNPKDDYSGSVGYGLSLKSQQVIYDFKSGGPKVQSLLEDASLAEGHNKPLVWYPEHNSQYAVPGAVQTHELAIAPSSKKGHHQVLVSQYTNSQLVQMTCNDVGKCSEAVAFIIRDQWSGLHGLDVNGYIEGKWGAQIVFTLQNENSIGLLNVSSAPGLSPEFYEPIIDWTVSLNVGALAGPHRTLTLDGDVYGGCKTSNDIVKIPNLYKKRGGKWTTRNVKKRELVVYPAQSSLGAPRQGPIFLEAAVRADGKKFVYGSLEEQGYLVRIDPTKKPSDDGAIKFINVKDLRCPVPIGLINGLESKAEIWFSCGVEDGQGTGTFGRVIDEGDDPKNITIWQTDSVFSRQAAYLHLAWTAGTLDGFPQLALLSSSILGGDSMDGLTTVTFSKDFAQIRKNSYMSTLRQGAMNHRVVVVGDKNNQVIYTDGTADGVVSALYRKGLQSYEQVFNPNDDYSLGPPLNLYGQGLPEDKVIYKNAAK